MRLFGFDFGALPFRDRFWCVVRWCWGRSQPAGNKIYQDWRGPGGIEPETCRVWGLGPGAWCPFGWILVRGAPFRVGFWCAVRRFWARFWCAVRRFWARFWCAVCGAPILGPISVHGVPFRRFWARFWCAVRRFWARFWCAVCGAPIFGPISVHGAPFWARRIGEDLGGTETETCRIWGLGPGAWGWIFVRGAPFRVGFAVFGLDFGARCAVFGLDFGARCVVRRFWGRFRCTVRRFWARFWCAVRRFWDRFWCAVCGAPILGVISVHGVPFWGRFWCGAPFLGWILVRGMWCADFGADFGARCVVFGFDFGARCAVFGLNFGAWCADVGVDHSQRATRSIKTWTFCFLALCWAPLSWPQNVVTTLFKTIASFLHA